MREGGREEVAGGGAGVLTLPLALVFEHLPRIPLETEVGVRDIPPDHHHRLHHVRQARTIPQCDRCRGVRAA